MIEWFGFVDSREYKLVFADEDLNGGDVLLFSEDNLGGYCCIAHQLYYVIVIKIKICNVHICNPKNVT